MKRLTALVLSAVFVICLCGCDKENKKNGDKIDIEYFANVGQIPENEITLGTTPEKLMSTIAEREKEAIKNGEDYGYNEHIGENNVCISEGPYDYYYKKANPEKGIGYIVSYVTAFGFETGEAILNVENAVKDFDYTVEAANENNAFFYIGDYSLATVLRVSFEKNTVVFVFENNALAFTAIYSKDIWN